MKHKEFQVPLSWFSLGCLLALAHSNMNTGSEHWVQTEKLHEIPLISACKGGKGTLKAQRKGRQILLVFHFSPFSFDLAHRQF